MGHGDCEAGTAVSTKKRRHEVGAAILIRAARRYGFVVIMTHDAVHT